MLSKDGIIARYILSFCFFFASGTEILTGWHATISGVLGCVELATALLKYSPLYELWAIIKNHYQQNKALE
ncbi:MAG: hypothetical protein PHP26_10780 [Syntrophomonas sp.]|uniref:YgaP-like transmembrane domain n=1 Tax=Syntrophomonas sp. TaxID=2053627 RepID=UPI002635737C|nr:YgaP-like transmembrane domain [Syntrophomonas sp.]MDD2510729.1 hypothetical protein [Syntrophomonas sp.]MDD3880450.1 hypothetical protein [Syntrophomonas sp.]MDD4627320.1 hypothetical protein [Syntrophomonas sp.]